MPRVDGIPHLNIQAFGQVTGWGIWQPPFSVTLSSRVALGEIGRKAVYNTGKICEKLCFSLISLMNHTTDQEIVMQKIKETFNYRQRLIHNTDESHTILTVFPRLLDTKGLVSNGIFFFFQLFISVNLIYDWHKYELNKVSTFVAADSSRF